MKKKRANSTPNAFVRDYYLYNELASHKVCSTLKFDAIKKKKNLVMTDFASK